MQQIPSPTQMNLHKRGIGTNGESGWLKPCVPGTPFLQVPLYSILIHSKKSKIAAVPTHVPLEDYILVAG